MKLINPFEHLKDLFWFIPWQEMVIRHFICAGIIFIAWAIIFQSFIMGVLGAISAIFVVHLIFYVIDCI